MPTLNNMTRTDISAIVSVLLFCVTILVSAVGPAQAEGTSTDTQTASPAVSLVTPGYRA